MDKKVTSLILQLPLILIMIASFFASIYAAIKKMGGISMSVPLILGTVIALYFYGRYLETKSKKWGDF
jgi:hypothetical protein